MDATPCCLGMDAEWQCDTCARRDPEAWQAPRWMVVPLELRRGGACGWRVPIGVDVGPDQASEILF